MTVLIKAVLKAIGDPAKLFRFRPHDMRREL